MKSFGQTNYEGYYAQSGGKSLISGDPLPAWEALKPEIQAAWEAGAEKVIKSYAENVLGDTPAGVTGDDPAAVAADKS